MHVATENRKTFQDRPNFIDVASATANVRKLFPFDHYLGSMRFHRVIAQTVMRHLRSGTILDFGAGACDKAAVLAFCGYNVWACDDLADTWHLKTDNRERIIAFARSVGIDLFICGPGRHFPYDFEQFDLVLISEVLEHLHDSPLELLTNVVEWLKPGGLLLLTVPNAANIRKRIRLLLGASTYPPYDSFFWSSIPWRGHVREYVLADLRSLSRFMQLETVELRDIHRGVDWTLRNRALRYLYLGLTAVLPITGLRDDLLLLARKPIGWSRKKLHPAGARVYGN